MQLDQCRFIANCIFKMNHFSVGYVRASRAKQAPHPHLTLAQELLFWQKEQRSNVDTSECKNTSVFTVSSMVYFQC